MPTNTNSVTVIGNRLPAYVMGRPRSAYRNAYAQKATVREISPVSDGAAQAVIAA